MSSSNKLKDSFDISTFTFNNPYKNQLKVWCNSFLTSRSFVLLYVIICDCESTYQITVTTVSQSPPSLVAKYFFYSLDDFSSKSSKYFTVL